MKGTKNKMVGPAIVIGIVVLATLGTGLTWRNYVADRPSALKAELLDGAAARAEFASEVTPRIQPGTKAIISRDGVRSTGYVEAILPTASGTSFRIKLLQPFNEALPGTPCEVTVDLSIPPELLKDRGP
jgi:hypothetical protein